MVAPDKEALERATKAEFQDKILQREATAIDSRLNRDGVIRGLLSHDPNPLRSFDADPLNRFGAGDRLLFRPGQFSLQPRSWQYLYEARDGSGRLRIGIKLMERSVDEIVVAGSGANPNKLSPDFILKQTGRRRPDLDTLTATCDAKASEWIRQRDFRFLLSPPDRVFGPRLADFPAYRKVVSALPVMPDDIRRGVQLIRQHSLDWNTPFSSMAAAAEHGLKHRNSGAGVLVDTLDRFQLDLSPGAPLDVKLLEVVVPYDDMMVRVEHMVGALPRSVATAPGGDTWQSIRALFGTDASVLPHIATTETFYRNPHFFYWIEYGTVVSKTGDLEFTLPPRVRLPGQVSRSKDALLQAVEADPLLTKEGKAKMLERIKSLSEADNPRLRHYREVLEPIEQKLTLAAKSMHEVVPAKMKPFVRVP